MEKWRRGGRRGGRSCIARQQSSNAAQLFARASPSSARAQGVLRQYRRERREREGQAEREGKKARKRERERRRHQIFIRDADTEERIKKLQ